jgi:glycosyltransferase involved in cell wall biosynthesis
MQRVERLTCSLVIPVYRNEANLDRLLDAMVWMGERTAGELEVVFVVDGSPDRSFEILRERLPRLGLRTQLLSLSRNFGSFAAITAGLQHARGEVFAVMAADLQEPPELTEQIFQILRAGEADVVFGVRSRRADPWLSGAASNLFWWLYRRFVIPDMPPGGVDMFGCNRVVRDRLVEFRESNTNLIALLFWLGYRRRYVVYERRERLEGKSAWTFKKKLRYAFDSIFNFTDLPIYILLYGGLLAFLLACAGTVVVTAAKLAGDVPVPGYTPIVLAVMFFGALTSLGFGIIGQYLWLTLQNTRRRPNFVVRSAERLGGVPTVGDGVTAYEKETD